MPRRPNEGLPDVEEYQCIAQFRSLIQAEEASQRERACQKGPALPPARAIGDWSRSARSSPPSRRARATRRTVLASTPRSRHEVVSREDETTPGGLLRGPASSLGGRGDLTRGRRAREAEAVPCQDGVHSSAEPIQRPGAPEAPEDPPYASERASGLGERAMSAVEVLVRVDPPHRLGDRLARESHRRRVIDELPRHHADPGWKASPGEVRGPRAYPAIPVEDQGGWSAARVRRRLVHDLMVSVRARRST